MFHHCQGRSTHLEWKTQHFSKIQIKRRPKSLNKHKTLSNIENATESSSYLQNNYCSKFTVFPTADTYGLPLEGKLIVSSGTFKKKENIRCEVTSPNNRWCTIPPLSYDETLLSEIYMLTSSCTYSLRKLVKILVPFSIVDDNYFVLKANVRWGKENDWTETEFITKCESGINYAEINLSKLGSFAVSCIPRTEQFQLTSSGCLYYSRLSRYISVRCPRTSIDGTLNCTLQMTPLTEEILTYCQQNYSIRCEDILECSEIIGISCDQKHFFRRPVTLKLPLPNAEARPNNRHLDDIEVLMKKSRDSEWILMENEYKFTKNTVSFEVQYLAKYCVAQAAPGRKRRLKDGMRVIEEKIDIVIGTMALFVRFEDMQWCVVVSCHSLKNSKKIENKWKENNFVQIQSDKTSQFNTSGKPLTYFRFDGPELKNNQTWVISVSGQMKVSENDEDDIQLTYNQGLIENNKIFFIQPLGKEVYQLAGQIKVIPQDIYDEELRVRLTGSFTVEVSANVVEAYLKKAAAIEEMHQEKLKEAETTIVVTVPVQPVTTVKRKTTPKSSHLFDLLSRSVQPPRLVDRPANVLSGRSLMNLACVIPDAIALATHLGLSDSSISGIGFDALAGRLTTRDVNYKILLYWKRNHPGKAEEAVNDLAQGINELGFNDLATVILNQHAENRGLTLECLTHFN
uniref:Death domain-containing protein n=1 Tax=Octopus bimaculoides TaxID=37653 RepID=A0A0L8I026_OCTBM